MNELFLRFAIGGIVVSAFAVLGDSFKPKSFAGLFGAAPSLALATLALTIAWRRRRLCHRGSPFDDRRGNRLLRVCMERQLRADAVQS